MIDFKKENNSIHVKNLSGMILSQTLDCGQAFRWRKLDDESWIGVAYGKYLKISECNDEIIFHNTTETDFINIWADYFDMNRDYMAVKRTLCNDKILNEAIEYGSGIHILNQEPWEALCSFIISQNNNIPRIKGIIERLCENFGESVNGMKSFPSAEIVSRLSLDDLSVLRSGFRAKYISDAATKVASGSINLSELINMNLSDAENKLLEIYGVGKKVADCTLLFGLKHIDAFPVDVWMKRAMEKLYNGTLPDIAVPYAGIAQQYIFNYARMTKLSI